MTAATSVKLDANLKDRVPHLAAARRRSAHWIMREAITQYVEREEKREAFKQDALRAWEDDNRTGLHASAEEADDAARRAVKAIRAAHLCPDISAMT